MKNLAEQREKNLKILQEKMNLDKKQIKNFNPVSPIYIPLLLLL